MFKNESPIATSRDINICTGIAILCVALLGVGFLFMFIPTQVKKPKPKTHYPQYNKRNYNNWPFRNSDVDIENGVIINRL